MTASSGAVVGSFSGPAGTLFGASIGLCIDYVNNKGVELMQRGQFLHDINVIIASTQKIYYSVLEEELNRALNVLFEDAIQLMPRVLEKA